MNIPKGWLQIAVLTCSVPKHQAKLALLLFAPPVVVVFGSLIGEAAGIKDKIKLSGPWFWLGNQGQEYLDLGRLWQILLIAGMLIWLVILIRLPQERWLMNTRQLAVAVPLPTAPDLTEPAKR